MKTRLPFQVQSRDDSQTDQGIETKTPEHESRNISIFFRFSVCLFFKFIFFFEVLKFVTRDVLNDFITIRKEQH